MRLLLVMNDVSGIATSNEKLSLVLLSSLENAHLARAGIEV